MPVVDDLITPPAYEVWGEGGEHCILFSGCQSFRDSDFVSTQYAENELMEFD